MDKIIWVMPKFSRKYHGDKWILLLQNAAADTSRENEDKGLVESDNHRSEWKQGRQENDA